MYTRKIFVFGSNTEGIHGAGAADYAYREKGAIWGQASGIQGDSYAIITKDLKKGRRSIPLELIKSQVAEFIHFAHLHPEMEFQVSAIGCGYAGFKPNEVAPMFEGAPGNVVLPEEFMTVINEP